MVYSAKRKMTHKLGGKIYRFENAFEKKSDAKQEAETYRRRGKKARVIEQPYRGYDKWSVYTRK